MTLRDRTVGDERASVARAGAVLRALRGDLMDFAREVDGAGGPPTFTGCGSSLDAAGIATAGTGIETVSAGDVRVAHRTGALVAVSRSGRTPELLRASAEIALPYVVTCDPAAPLAKGADHVLDLSSAQDSGFVAAGSTLVTAASLAVIAAPDAERDTTFESVAEALDEFEPRSAVDVDEVVWLSGWALLPLGRELVRKSIETGRSSVWGHPYEFLHGEEAAVTPTAAWVLIDDDVSAHRLLELTRLDERVSALSRIPIPARPTPADLIRCLGVAFTMLFHPDEKAPHA